MYSIINEKRQHHYQTLINHCVFSQREPCMPDINLCFLGGSDKVGSLSMLMDIEDKRFLFDYGMTPSKPPEFPMPAPAVDAVFLSHAHLDHSGMIPALSENGSVPFYMEKITGTIGQLLFKDSIKIAKSEGYALPFTNDEVRNVKHNVHAVKPSDTIQCSDNVEILFHPAGHIPGSLMTQVTADKKCLFTGDFNTQDTHLVNGTKPVKCDILIMEGTYAGRNHPMKRDELEKAFIDAVEDVIRKGGVVVLPSFAVSRSQELAMVLRKTGLNIWYDGMGKKVAKIFLKHSETLRFPQELKKTLNHVNYVHSDHGRKLALNSDIILTSSGMMDGGPVLHYMNKLKNDAKSAVFLTGYQVEGTNSRLLMDEKKLDFYGVMEPISCKVDYFDFSGHAGHDELVEFARLCEPEKIILMHSDNREALIEPLQSFAEVYAPNNGESITI